MSLHTWGHELDPRLNPTEEQEAQVMRERQLLGQLYSALGDWLQYQDADSLADQEADGELRLEAERALDRVKSIYGRLEAMDGGQGPRV